MEIITFIALGILAGILSGLFGIGGGIILIPALVLGCGFSQQRANGTSLVALLLPVGILAVREYYRAGKIGVSDIRGGLLIAIGIFLGAYVGSKLALRLPEVWLRRGFAALLVYSAVRLILKK